WTRAELDAALGAERGKLAAAAFAVEGAGRSVLRLLGPVDAALRSDLLAARARRPAPAVDRKPVAAWNGLMITALARGALVLDEPRFARAAAEAARFVLEEMRPGGKLRRTLSAPAVLDDFAFLEQGLLDLHELTGEARWLDEALALQRELDARFWDEQGGGYWLAAPPLEPGLRAQKPWLDGAEPSGNSVAALNLERLATLTADERHRRRAARLFSALAPRLKDGPEASPLLLAALDAHL